jgi:pimeloyl-ACP methyl ester carboxylesterase
MSSFHIDLLQVRGCQIMMRRMGAGRPLLFLHGLDGPLADPAALELLAQDFEVLAPDHPGFGESGDSDRIEDVGDLAYFYLDLIDQLGLKEIHLVGHSLGGWIALEMAVRNATSLSSLTLAGAAGIDVPGVAKGDIFICTGEEYGALVRAPGRPPLPAGGGDERQVYRNRLMAAKLCWHPRLFNPGLEKWLHRVPVPTLVLWGGGDQVLPPAYGVRIAEQIPGAQQVTLAGVGHMLPVESPAAFANAVKSFVKGTAS